MTRKSFSEGDEVVIFREEEDSPDALDIKLPQVARIHRELRKGEIYDYWVEYGEGDLVKVHEDEIRTCEHGVYLYHTKKKGYFCPFCDID